MLEPGCGAVWPIPHNRRNRRQGTSEQLHPNPFAQSSSKPALSLSKEGGLQRDCSVIASKVLSAPLSVILVLDTGTHAPEPGEACPEPAEGGAPRPPLSSVMVWADRPTREIASKSPLPRLRDLYVTRKGRSRSRPVGECRGQALCRGRGGVPHQALRVGGREEQRSSNSYAKSRLRGRVREGAAPRPAHFRRLWCGPTVPREGFPCPDTGTCPP